MIFKRLFGNPPSSTSAPPPPAGDPHATAAPLAIDLARETMSYLQQSAPGWTTGYVRVAFAPGFHEARASYVASTRVELVNAMRNEFIKRAGELGARVGESLGCERGVVLLIAQSDFSYEIKLERDDMNRWMITKLAGATGLPAGLDPA